jgi:prolyl-tRNA synthetase
MHLSKLLIPTLRDIPKEAEVVSHQLLVRGGYIRQVASGIYNLLPLMYRVVHKINTIVREELDSVGCQELLMPIMQPADLWHQSQRWEAYGPELIRLKDRHERDCVLGPTHEEVITAIAGQNITSYKQLPMNLYQIQLKFRDERRPRFGLLRGREFMMKDAYSFHADENCLETEYQRMATAYTNIFDRCGLETVMVRSDSGAIGGSVSHEFMVLTNIAEGEQESGENVVFYCDESGYSANADRAESILPDAVTTGPEGSSEVIDTPNATSIEQLHTQHGFLPSLILKSLLYMVDDQPVMALIRGDVDVEDTKLKNAAEKAGLSANQIRLAEAEEIKTLTGSSKGFIGPVALPDSVTVIADNSVKDLKNFYVATNEAGKHRIRANWGAEVPTPTHFADIRLARRGDLCPISYPVKGHTLKQTRGIEVGNIFKLGTKYSEVMNAKFATEDGKEAPFTMGCYGIGTTRTAAAAVERYHDANGIIWPMAIAPYHAIVIPVNTKDETQVELANKVYEALKANGLEVVIDDRKERAGVKFNDADLIGYPIRITAGKKAADGLLECKMRDESAAQDLPFDEAVSWAIDQFKTWKPVIK